MEFKRKLATKAEPSSSLKPNSPSSGRAYEAFKRPEPAKKPGFRPNWITAIAAVPLVAVVIYFSTDPMNPAPTVERVDNSIADTQAPDGAQAKTADAAKPVKVKLPQPSFSDFNNSLVPDENLANSMNELRAESKKIQIDADQALAKKRITKLEPAPEADAEWTVDGFDQESLDILAKNTKLWAQMAQLELDKAEIAKARRMAKTYKLSDAGEIVRGPASLATGNPAATTGASCSLTIKPRSPDPKCRANHPCRICGGCCCMCEAVLSGLAVLGEK